MDRCRSKWLHISGARRYKDQNVRGCFQRESGYILERKVFDRALAQKAAMAGAEVMVKTRATGLLKTTEKSQVSCYVYGRYVCDKIQYRDRRRWGRIQSGRWAA